MQSVIAWPLAAVFRRNFNTTRFVSFILKRSLCSSMFMIKSCFNIANLCALLKANKRNTAFRMITTQQGFKLQNSHLPPDESNKHFVSPLGTALDVDQFDQTKQPASEMLAEAMEGKSYEITDQLAQGAETIEEIGDVDEAVRQKKAKAFNKFTEKRKQVLDDFELQLKSTLEQAKETSEGATKTNDTQHYVYNLEHDRTIQKPPEIEIDGDSMNCDTDECPMLQQSVKSAFPPEYPAFSYEKSDSHCKKSICDENAEALQNREDVMVNWVNRMSDKMFVLLTGLYTMQKPPTKIYEMMNRAAGENSIFNPLFHPTVSKEPISSAKKNYKIDLNVPKFQVESNNKVSVFEISSDGICVLHPVLHKDLLASIYDENSSIASFPSTTSLNSMSSSPYVRSSPSLFPNASEQSTPLKPFNHHNHNISKLNSRDLRRLDYQINPNEGKSVYVRYHVVVFSMDSIRAIVTPQKLLFIVPPGADSILSTMEASMKGWDNSSESFELHVYDALLNSMLTLDSHEYRAVNEKFHDILRRLKKHSFISLKMQERLRLLKNDIAKFTRHISNTQKILNDLMEDEDRLALMNLTYLKENPQFYSHNATEHHNHTIPQLLHEKVANLFELYLVDYNNLSSQMEFLSTQMQNAEESESLRLDSSRNQLMIVNAVLSVLTCILGFCAYITGAFGMNLDNVSSIQPVKGVFNTVFLLTFFFIPIATVSICWGLMKYGYIPV